MKFAVNPLQWLATEDGWLDFTKALPLPILLERVAQAGFDAIQLDVPEGLDATAYATALTEHGLVPAPGYLSMPLDDVGARPDFVSSAEQLAALHAELGLTEMFVSGNMSRDAPRVLRPAHGSERDDARLERIAESLQLVGEATQRHGVASCVHPHVGTWIEVEEEIDRLLEQLDADVVALGPDTGHLAWAGADPLAIARRYSDRIRAIHIKDIRLAVAERHRGDDASYRDVVRDGLWVEPGRGDLDFQAILAQLRPELCSWAIVEVDKPDLATPEESLAASAAWARDAAAWSRQVQSRP
jgi:inosose dehydratase